jgi:5-methylcytosine-specific restriction endonuclease McrA
MRRKPPFDRCDRRWIPGRLRADILLRQDGRCADCSTRLILRFFIFDHRPPLALREKAEDANDPDRLAAICWTCDQQKTPRDLKEIARAKRLAEKHQEHLDRQRDRVPGRRLPSSREWMKMQRSFGRRIEPCSPPESAERHRSNGDRGEEK